MLHIEAKIGDCINVTFIKSHHNGQASVQTLERINGRPAFLDRNSDPARPSDKCVVKIVAENPKGTVYFVKLVSIIQLGDGQSALLEKVIAPILWTEGLHGFDPKGTAKGLKIASDHFGNDELGLLELIFDMLELLILEYNHSPRWLNHALIRSTACRIVDKCLTDNPAAAAEAYLDLASTCGTSSEIIGDLLAKALALCESSTNDVGSILERTLRAIDKNDSGGEFGSGSIELKKRLLTLSEQSGTFNIAARMEIARMWLNKGNTSEAKAMLETVNFELQGDHIACSVKSLIGNDVARMMGEAYVLDRNYAEAKSWLEKAAVNSEDYEVKQHLANALLELGEFEQAAVMFKQALEICAADLKSANENYD